MKLVFAIKSLYSVAGGAERVICSICSQLSERGHDVVLVTWDQEGQVPFFHLDERVRRINLGIGDTSASSGFRETFLRMKVLRQIIKEQRPDVVTGFMHSMFIPLGFSLVGTQIPLIGSEHAVPEYYRQRPLQWILLVMVTPFVQKITVLSESIRRRYPVTLQRKMVVMPNPMENFSEHMSVKVIKDRFTILCVGRLVDFKNHGTLIRAFAKIANEFPKWDLRIIGEGVLRPDLESLVKSLKIRNRVNMPGNTQCISEEYQAADLFVIPSHYEAFGLVTAEAMTHRLPVVGFSNCPGTNELIESGRTGILVDSTNDHESALAVVLKTLIENPDLRLRLGEAAQKAIDHKFSIHHITNQWESLLAKIVSSSKLLNKKILNHRQ